MSEISNAKMNSIINRSIEETGKCSNNPVDTEMIKFGYEYRMRLNENIQLNLFDEHWPAKEDVRMAVGFCNYLEQYHQATNVYAKECPELEMETCRKLLQYIQYFRPVVANQNLATLNGMERSLKYRLPECRPLLLLEDFNCHAEMILQDKKRQKYLKQKKQPYDTQYEQRAKLLLQEITFTDELKQLKPSREKIQLLQNCLQLINCLPVSVKRTKKFQYKCSINNAIAREARLLTPPDLELAQNAHNEAQRYHNAIEKALSYADSDAVKRRLRNQRNKNDWDYL